MQESSYYCSFIKSEIGFWIVKSDDQAIIDITFSDIKPEEAPEENEISKEGASQLAEYFNKKRQSFNLPPHTDKYTLFYQEVWTALSNIPFGRTMSYSQLAHTINKPNAVRAVGMANGKNPFPIIIPCHRVIGKDQKLTGYAYGLKVKKWLLEHEGVFAEQGSLF